MLLKKDIEEEGLEEEEQPPQTLDKIQKELVTSTVDYNLDSLSSLVNEEKINLKPQYQRRYRWGSERQSKLIESFLMNIPIPPIYLNEDAFGTYSVIDGKQRLYAISEFLYGRFKLTGLGVFSDLNGLYFKQLPEDFKNTLKTRATIRAVIILRQSSKEIKYIVFNRLNTGGVRLNAQEIRNSTFPSDLNDKVLAMSEGKEFHKMLGIKSLSNSRIYEEMYDVELVIRFMALKDTWAGYSGNLKKILDSFMEDGVDMKEEKIQELEKDFIETLEKVKTIFGDDGSFRRWIVATNKWKQQVSMPIFDAQMLSCYKKDKNSLVTNKNEILNDFKSLFSNDPEFIKSIESSTASPQRFLYRVKKMDEIIEKYL